MIDSLERRSEWWTAWLYAADVIRKRAERAGATVGSTEPGATMSMRRVAYLLFLATLVSVPFEDLIKLPGIGTLSRVFGLLTFAAWALSALERGRMRPPTSFLAFAYGFVVWAALGFFWSLDTTSTIERIQTFLQLLALSLVAWDLCDTRRTIQSAFQALVIGLGVAAASLFVNFARGTEAYYGRFAASGADPNYMSMVLALGIPLAWYSSQHSERRVYRILNVLYIPVALVAMGLTGSRGGFIAGFVALAYIFTSIRRLTLAGLVATLVVLGGAVSAISYLVPDTTIERIASVDDEIREGDLNGRARIWLEARDAFLDRPLVGIGAGASRAVLPTGKVGHNVAITVALEFGFVGFVLFAGMVARAVRGAIAVPRPDRRMWLMLLVIWGIGSLSLSLETRKITWILFSLMALAPDVWRVATTEDQLPDTLMDELSGRPAGAS